MWLIDTKTLALKEFINHPKGQYAILSHRWEEEEVSFRGWNAQEGIQGKGGLKLMEFFQVAKERGFEYAWADTCCINKESSAELSESINSMFMYYEDSGACFTYLSDYEDPSKLELSDDSGKTDQTLHQNGCTESKWFTRGWTLQELIAPSEVLFFDVKWQLFGTKESLKKDIADATRVPQAVLDGSKEVQKYSIADRMAWASTRTTTRIEDVAYSLLGIFGINMPLLYGEGRRAFLRLQEEICRSSTDLSMFAWTKDYTNDPFSGILSPSPREFKDSTGIIQASEANQHHQTDFNDEIAITNRGICFNNMILYSSPIHGVLLDLLCHKETSGDRLFISLVRGPKCWIRSSAQTILYLPMSELKYLYKRTWALSPLRSFVLKTAEPGSIRAADLYDRTIQFGITKSYELKSVTPSHLWDWGTEKFLPTPGFCGALHILIDDAEFIVLCTSENSESPEWFKKYTFTVVPDTNSRFSETRAIICKEQLHLRSGFLDVGRLFSIIRPLIGKGKQSRWSEANKCFNNIEVWRKSFRLSLRVEHRKPRSASGGSWEELFVSITYPSH